MNPQKFIDDIQAHPLVVALVIFGGLFVFFNVFNKKSPTATATAGGIPTASTPSPTGTETYAQQFTSYPSYNQPVVQMSTNAPAIPTTPATNNPAPVANVYNGVLGVSGQRHPADIGPWVAGRRVTYSGVTYTLKPGADGRLWGDVVGGQSGVLLWNGSDRIQGAPIQT